MESRFSTWLENGTLALILAAIVLVGGIGYGLYDAKNQPAESVEAGPAVRNIPAEKL